MVELQYMSDIKVVGQTFQVVEARQTDANMRIIFMLRQAMRSITMNITFSL